MILPVMLAVVKPWTHWIAPPLLVVEIAYLVTIGIRYYRKVQAPWYLLRLRQERQQRYQRAESHPAASG